MMLFKKTLLLMQGFVIVSLLGIFTVDPLITSRFNVFMAFVFIIGFSWFSPSMKNRTDRIFILILPIFYLILLCFTANFLDPALYKFLTFILLCIYLIFQTLSKFSVFILLELAYTFTFGIDVYISEQIKKIERKEQTITFEIKEEEDISINLRDFNFLNSEHELVQLTDSDKYYVVETWAEWCAPCMSAIKEMAPYFEKNKQNFNHVLLYSDKRFLKLKNPDRIWSFLENVDQSKILVDQKRLLSGALDNYSLPLFIIFDKEGNFVDLIKGYIGEDHLKRALEKYIE